MLYIDILLGLFLGRKSLKLIRLIVTGVVYRNFLAGNRALHDPVNIRCFIITSITLMVLLYLTHFEYTAMALASYAAIKVLIFKIEGVWEREQTLSGAELSRKAVARYQEEVKKSNKRGV